MTTDRVDHLMEIITRFTDIMHQKSSTDAVLNTTLNNIERYIRDLHPAISRLGQEFDDISSIINRINENIEDLEKHIKERREVDSNLEIAKIQHVTDIVKVKHESRSKIITTIGSIIIAAVSSFGTFLYVKSDKKEEKEKPRIEEVINSDKIEDNKPGTVEQ